MNRRHKGKMDIEIDGFVIFLIGVFVVLPLARTVINKFPGGSESPVSEVRDGETPVEVIADELVSTTSSAVFAKFKSIDLSSGEKVANINEGVRFNVEDDVVKVTSKSPSGEEGKLEIKKYLRNRYVGAVFNEEGTWEITFYDKDGFALNWHKISVY